LGCRAALVLAVGIVGFNLFAVGVALPWVGVAVLALMAWRKLRGGRGVSGNFGFARFAGWADLIRGRLTGQGDRGWFMGRLGYVAPPTRAQAIRSLCNPLVPSEMAVRQCFAAFGGARRGGDDFIRINDGVHAAVFAPAGAGKTTKMLGPNLLSYSGNCVVVDPKGELFDLTAKHRRRKFGHKIVRLDPALWCGPGANRFNPFDFIDPETADFVDRCRDLANMLVVRTGLEQEPFWSDAAETAVTAFSAHVCAAEQEKALRNLRGMRELLASRENYAHAVEEMQKNDKFYGVLKQLGGQLSWHVDKQLAGVMGHAQQHTNIFDSPLIAHSTGSTDWNPAELRSGRMTVYLIVPGDKLVIWAGLMRMWLGSILRIITRGKPTEKNPVLFLVDEAAHIGRMQALEDGITLMRGMGIRIFLFFQSLDQVNKCFGERASTVLDNLGTQLYFGINSYETADALSKRIGDVTIANVTDGSNSGMSWSSGVRSDGHSRNTGSSVSVTETGIRLVRAEEVLTADGSSGFLFHRNHPIILCQMIEYFSDKAFRWRWWRGYGTGRSRGLGLDAMVVSLAALGLSVLLTAVVARVPVPVRQQPYTAAPGVAGSNSSGEFFWRFDSPENPRGFQPAPYGPGPRRPGGRPLPRQSSLRNRSGYSGGAGQVRGGLYHPERQSYP
jgi:type IV secretion system protein VirD4